MLRRIVALFLVAASTAAMAPLVSSGTATAEASEGPSIPATATVKAAVTVAGGALELQTGTGGPNSGPAPAAAAATASSSASTDATGEWPTGNRDRARTGNAAWEEFISVPAGSAWTSTTTDKVQLNPAIVDDVAYFGGAGTDKRVYAVDLQTGATLWSVGLPGSVLSSPAVAGGWVYFASADGHVYRLAAETGELSWSYPGIAADPVGGFVGAIALHDGVLYAASLDTNLYAIDAISGQELWHAATPEAITAGVSVADGKVVRPLRRQRVDHRLQHRQPRPGRQRNFYNWTNPNTLGTAASISASHVYLTGLDSKLHILDVTTGADTITPPNLGSWAQNTPVPAANKVFVGTNNGRALAFDPATGAQLWATTLNTFGIVSSPVFAGSQGQELVFAASTDGSLYGLDAATGTREWQYTTGGALFAAPAIVSNHILFGSDDRNLYGLVPGLPDNRSYAPPPPVSHTYGMQPWQQYSWDPVATSTGNYVYQQTDVSLPGRGIPIGYARSYNSLDAATNGPLGYGWTFNANATLSPDPGGVTIRWGDGSTDGYTGPGPTFTPPRDGHDTLTALAGGGWELETVSHLRYRFDLAGKLTALLDASGNQTTLGYDASGRLATMTDASAHTLTFAYDASNRITSVTDPLGRSWTYTYTAAGDLATAADNAGKTWRYGYDTAHRLETLHDPDNNLVIDNTYDAQGRVIDQVDSAGGVWAYTYNAASTVVTDPLGKATTYNFDTNYRTTSVVDPLGNTTRWIYDGESNLVATVDPTGRASQFRYDTNGNLTAALDPLGHKTAFAYDGEDNLTSVTNLKGETATFAYDAANRLTGTTTPTALSTHVAYRPDGLVDAITDGAGNSTTYGYTPAGMPLTVTDPLNRVSRVAVDAAGQVTSTTDPLNRVTGYGYDPAGRLDVITDPAANTIRYGYDNTGRTTSYTDQNNHTTTYTYDSRGLRTATTDPLGRVDRVGYDLARRATTSTNARNQTTTVTYDMADRPVGIDYPAGTPDVTTTLDDAGRPLTFTDSTGTTTYTYDTGGRLVSKDRGLANATLTYRYDMLNRRSQLSLTRSGGLTARNTYTYDPDGRISALTDSAGGETRFAYDNAGRLDAITHPNAVAATYAYDAASQITGITTTRTATTGASSLISSYQYGYDNGGQRTLATRLVAGAGTSTNTFAYDPLGRLTAATSTDPTAPPDANATWAYDNAGNRTQQAIARAVPTTYTYDAADQLISDGTRSYTWDPDGNLTRRHTTLGGATLATYTWDPANRITTQTTPDQTTSYTYDAASRRVTKTDPTGTSTYLYDGGDLLEELTTAPTGGDAVETTAGGTVLNRITATGTAYLHPDANANIGEVTNPNGTLQTRYAYAPWGNQTTTNTNSATDPYRNRHTFAGATGVRDDNGGLTDMRNRMYDPTLGTFLNRDPIEAVTREPYAYAGNNPLNNIDPSGLNWLSDRASDVGGAIASGGDDLWDNTGGKAVSFVDDHKVGVLKVTSIGLGAGAIVAAPFTGGTSLAALPAVLSVGSVGTAVAAEALDPKPGRAQRVTFTIGVGMLGGAVSGAFSEGGLAAWGLLTDLGMLGADLLPVGRSSSMARVRC